MSSDFGTNKRRIDIRVNSSLSTSLKCVSEIVEALTRGEKVVHADLDFIDMGENTYSNELVSALRGLGFDDVRYGTMGWQMGGGEGYTCYKSKAKRGGQ